MVIFIDIHTLLCSNLFALSPTPNIVTPDTTLRPHIVARCSARHPEANIHNEEPFHNTAQEAKVKLSIKGSERKGRQTFGN